MHTQATRALEVGPVPAHVRSCPWHPDAPARMQRLRNGGENTYFCDGPSRPPNAWSSTCDEALWKISAEGLAVEMRMGRGTGLHGPRTPLREARAILAAHYRREGLSYPRQRAIVDLADALDRLKAKYDR